MKEYDSHPAAKLFPMMENGEMQELVADIKAHGLHNPITIYQGMILDGRNRYVACQQAKVEPRFETWITNGCSPTEWVLSVNLKRRQLTASQKATVALAAEKMFATEAADRMASGINQHSSPKEKIPEGSKGQARDKAAKLVGVNPRYISDAKKIKEEAPEVFKQVESGEKTISQAKRAIEEAKPKPERLPDYIPSSGMTFAKMAICQLERIHPKDTQREDAFDHVIAWIGRTRK